eukprot:739725-Prorocentrum_minimum.AAC.1
MGLGASVDCGVCSAECEISARTSGNWKVSHLRHRLVYYQERNYNWKIVSTYEPNIMLTRLPVREVLKGGYLCIGVCGKLWHC